MEYKFCLTPRLIALAIFSGIALMVLLFALGYQIGRNMAPLPASATPGSMLDAAQQRAASQLDTAAAAAAPLVKRASAPKAVP